MMVKVADIADFMNKFCPPSLSFDGDNVGLIEGRYEKQVKKCKNLQLFVK